jgi:hypothetical protein
MPYYSAVVWLYHLQNILFISFHTSNSNEIYNPVPFANGAYQFQRKLWGKSWPHSVASNYIYLFMWANLCILFLLYFKTPFSNMAETELKVTQSLEKPFTITIFLYTGSWCFVPFSSNISWDCKHKTVPCLTLVATGREWGQERDTQQENSNKLAAHIYNSCNSDAYHSERGCSYVFT